MRDSGKRRSSTELSVAVALLAFVVLAVDLTIPLGVAAGVPYVLVVLLCLWFDDPRLIIRVATVCSLLTLVGLLFSPGGGVLWMVLLNRALALFAIWVTAILCARWRSLHASLAQHQERLARVSRVNNMGELAAGIAHELNQPLSVISNYAEASSLALRSGDMQLPRLLQDLDGIARASVRAGEIVQRLRRMVVSKETERSEQDINELVAESVDLFSRELMRLKVDLVLQLDRSIASVLADPIQIQQVMLNLLRNASDAMEGCSRKEIAIQTISCESGAVEVSLRDSGVGLGETSIDGLFQHFVTTKKDGLGVGLAISRTIIEAHSGKLTAEQNPGGGMTFRFTLPRAASGEAGSDDT